MTRRRRALPPELRARLQSEIDREVSLEELRAALETPITDAEREHTLELIRWFRRRYPTPLERLAYVRRACRRWVERTSGES